MYAYTHVHAIVASKKKKSMNMKEIREGYVGVFRERKGKGEII